MRAGDTVALRVGLGGLVAFRLEDVQRTRGGDSLLGLPSCGAPSSRGSIITGTGAERRVEWWVGTATPT
jgi:hypothetical protein